MALAIKLEADVKHSIKMKTGFFLATVLLVAITVLSALVLFNIRNYQRQEFERALMNRGEIANDYIKQTYLMESIVDPETFIHTRAEALVKRFDLISGLRVVLYDMKGEIVADSRAYLPTVAVDKMMPYALEGQNVYVQRGNTVNFLTPLSNTNQQIGILRYDDDVTAMNAFFGLMTKRLMLMAGIVFVVMFIGAVVFSHPLTKGLTLLTASAAAIESGRQEEVKRLERTDELGELSDAIWHMGETIARQMASLQTEQEKLRCAVRDLEVMGQHQKRFIGNVTHEFRTPLTVIKAYADLIQMYETDMALHGEAAEHIQREVNRLSEMVNRILRLTAMDQYDFQLKCETFDLAECLADAVQQVQGKVLHRGLTMVQNLETLFVCADREAVMQIAVNLLDNAIKYNQPNGSITLSCRNADQMVCFEIADTGIGIPASEKNAIFEPFYRIDQNRTGGEDSSGLGLALVKGLVEKSGGMIAVEDEATGGTRFIVHLPRQLP